MTSPKKRRRAKRRNDRLRVEALQALAGGHGELAKRLIQRAVDAGLGNARLWYERGRILDACGEARAAEQSFRQAVQLAPTYADALGELARRHEARREWDAAAELAERAVAARGDDADNDERERAAALRERADAASPEVRAALAAAARAREPDGTRTRRYAWDAIGAELERRGCARLAALVAPDERQALRGERLLAPLADALRGELYWRLAPLANAWSAELGRPDAFAPTFEEHVATRARERKRIAAPCVIRRGPESAGALAALPPDARAFPWRVVVALGPRGGELVLADAGSKKRVRATRLALAPGDGAVVCTRARPARVAGVAALQPVLHGLEPEGETPLWVLEVPLDDERGAA